MEIISVSPRGYCQGVVKAIMTAQKTVKENPNERVSMLGMIVHNKHVVKACKDLGIYTLEAKGKTRLELLDEIDEGIVIFTAHGVSDDVYKKAKEKGLKVVDATCKDVAKTHDLVRNHVKNGDVIYIGKPHHPEAEGVVGLSNRVHLVSKLEDLNNLPDLTNVLITTQTTLSLLDTKDLIEACIKAYPDATNAPEICNATTIRQMAVMDLENIDVLIVVGDPHSNNSNQLKEIGLNAGIKHCYLIDDVTYLKEDMIKGADRIAVTSGSSTPTILTNQVISFLKEYATSNKFELPTTISNQIL